MRKSNFFDRQDELRRHLALLFFAAFFAVLCLAALAGWVTAFVGWAYTSRLLVLTPELVTWQGRLPYIGAASMALILLTVMGIYYLYWQRRFANAIANLGAREVHKRIQLADDLEDQLLLNVVFELSVAAGRIAPRVFELRGDISINSMSMSQGGDDFLFVTEGALAQLERDELQALCAHEFAHLENGDSGTNIGLLAIVSGLKALYTIGRSVLAALAKLPKLNPFLFVPLLFGFVVLLPMLIVGKAGVVLAHGFQWLITHKRIWLADAGALELTRDKQALIDLLRKTELMPKSNKIGDNSAATTFMRFAALPAGQGCWWDLHPKADLRITALRAI